MTGRVRILCWLLHSSSIRAVCRDYWHVLGIDYDLGLTLQTFQCSTAWVGILLLASDLVLSCCVLLCADLSLSHQTLLIFTQLIRLDKVTTCSCILDSFTCLVRHCYIRSCIIYCTSKYNALSIIILPLSLCWSSPSVCGSLRIAYLKPRQLFIRS